MARFPKNEVDIQPLALNIAMGLWDNSSIFPNPPVAVFGLIDKINRYTAAKNNAIATGAALQQTSDDKDLALDNLIDAMKADLRYAENTASGDDAKLKLIGWSGKKKPAPLKPPGQPRLLEAIKQGPGYLTLDWKPPLSEHEHGKLQAYKIQRLITSTTPNDTPKFQDIATALETEITLVNQPQKKKLQYRVIALNKAGPSLESNTVTVVL